MKNIIRALLFALMIGVLAYFAVYVINMRNSKAPTNTCQKVVEKDLEKEAKQVADDMDKKAKNVKQIFKKASDLVKDEKQVPPVIKGSYEEELVDTTDAMPGEKMETYAHITEPAADAEQRPDKSPELLKPAPKPSVKKTVVVDKPVPLGPYGPYRIQLGVHKPDADLSRYHILSGMGNLFTELTPKGNHRVLLGVYDHRSEANALLKQVKKAGFKDAFISKHKEIDLTPKAPPVEEKQSIVYTNDIINEPVKTTSFDDIYEEPRTIKLGVFSEPPMKQLLALNDLGQINMQITPNGYTSAMIGSYTDPADAKYMLKAVRQRGFPDAFIAKAPQMMCDDPPAEPIRKGSREWMIQVGASKNPSSFKRFEGLRTLGSLYVEYIESSDISKILLGPYYNEAMAKQAIGQVKTYGFEDAFLVNNKSGQSGGKRVKIFDASAGSFR